MDENRQPAALASDHGGAGSQAKTHGSGQTKRPGQAGPTGLEGRAASLVAATRMRLGAMEPGQRRWLGGAMLFTALCVAAIVWYAARTDWRTLYAGLDAQDAREMASELTAANIPYDVPPDGASLRVPAEYLDKARLTTTAKGGPRSGRMGFDLFDKPNWVGSEFDEKVNYQRALEGELEHTIDTLSDVESARVHLVMPHDSLFHDQQRDAKASVVLKLRSRRLPEDEAEAVRNLVASAVDDLHAENVVLVDGAGQLLGKPTGTAEVEAHEQQLAAKLVETLEPVAGQGNVHASVTVEYDTGSADEVDETYDPNSVVTLSMQRMEQTAGGPPVAAGVPGTASNAPNTQPPVYPKAASETQSEKQESGTYGASKKVRHTMQGAGKLHRLTAAVLINYQKTVSGKKVSWQARPAEEMKHMTELAQAAVGYDATRGDLVSVENLPFEDQTQPPLAIGERLMRIASSPQITHGGILVLAVLTLYLFIVRPMLRKLPAMTAPRALLAVKEAALSAGQPAPPQPDAALIAAEQHRLQAQEVFESVSDHLRREPAQSTRLLQSWIHTE
jgi:flagellar M-ring protein FliF